MRLPRSKERMLDTEIATLEAEAQQLATEIEELTGQPSRVSL